MTRASAGLRRRSTSLARADAGSSAAAALFRARDVPDAVPGRAELFRDADARANPGDSVIVAPGGKIAAVLPNDYAVIQESIAGTGPVSLDSLLGKAYLALAGSLAGHEMPLEAPHRFSALKNLFSPKKRSETVRVA